MSLAKHVEFLFCLRLSYHHNAVDCICNSKAICSLAFALDGIQLVAGSEDGMVRVWDTKTHNIIRVLKHAKGMIIKLYRSWQ